MHGVLNRGGEASMHGLGWRLVSHPGPFPPSAIQLPPFLPNPVGAIFETETTGYLVKWEKGNDPDQDAWILSREYNR